MPGMHANDASAPSDRRPSAPASDEVSLRELYLVVRRRLVWIALAAVVAGALAFAVLATRPPSFLAESTAVVARTPVTVTGEAGLQFRPELDITYETYATLAYSRSVLESVLDAVPTSGMSHVRLRDALTLERLAGSANQASSLLAVAHRARAGDADVAAALATEWARATIATVQALLNENLDAVERITSSELELARGDLGQAEQALRDFREANDATADPGRLAGTRQRAVALETRRDEVQRQVAAREAELASLASRANGDETVALIDAPEVPLTVTGAMWVLEARIAGLRAELELLTTQEAQVTAEIEALAATIARVQTTVAGLDRAVLRADAEVAALAAIEPTVAYVAQLAPAGARVLGEAAVPTAAEARPTLLIALLAAVVVAFAGIVLALLAEAVRDPTRAAR
jgi:uncharacterized protein involved in exopolysaccharide biosynthesis